MGSPKIWSILGFLCHLGSCSEVKDLSIGHPYVVIDGLLGGWAKALAEEADSLEFASKLLPLSKVGQRSRGGSEMQLEPWHLPKSSFDLAMFDSKSKATHLPILCWRPTALLQTPWTAISGPRCGTCFGLDMVVF